METNKCHICDRAVPTPVHVTEVGDDGSVAGRRLCAQCGETYMKNLEGSPDQPADALDLSHITTPEQLLAFLIGGKTPPPPDVPPCACGLTNAEFEDTGRFGCPRCYTHFTNQMEELVFPFHKARHHVGKRPRRGYMEGLMRDPVEREKILKLRYAKALELEEYEKAAEIRRELDRPPAEPPP